MSQYTNQVAEARLPLIIFGDGLQGQLLKIKRGVQSKSGVEEVECRIRPTKELFYYMGLKEEDLDIRDFSIIKRYPTSMVIPLNSDPTVATVLILCDFNGKDTPMTSLYATFTMALQGKEKVIKSLRGEVAWLHEEVKKVSSQEEKHLTETTRRLKHVMSLRGEPGAMDTAYDEFGGSGSGGNQNG